MSNINKQELRVAATKAMLEEGITWWDEGQLKNGVVLHQADAAFVAIASPAIVLAMLDELEAAEKRVAELESERDKQGRHACELFDEVTAQRQRFAELEAREVGPVYQVLSHDAWVDLSKGAMESQKRTGSTVRTLYTAPLAPVVPDELSREEYKRRFMDEDNFDDTYRGGWNACRAAMLQGAENAESLHTIQPAPALDSLPKNAESLHADLLGKTEPVSQRDELPEGWVACSERLPERDYVLAADFSGEYYPPCLPNTQVGIYADWFEDGNPSWDDGDGNDLHLKQVTHWMPLPAAPRQEVK